jgi:hypothetical protein
MNFNEGKHYQPKSKKVKAYQELNEEIAKDKELRNMQPTPEPKDFEEIEY